MNSATPPLFDRLEAALRDVATIVAQMRTSAQAEAPSEVPSWSEYLSVKQLADRIPYKEHTIRNLISAGVFHEGIHCYKRRRRVMFSWPAIQNWVQAQNATRTAAIPWYGIDMAIRTKAGKLFLDFRWRGVRCREFTGLPDTGENRRRLRAFDLAIAGEIALGTFDYRKHFPNGARLREFYGDEDVRRDSSELSVAQYLNAWHQQRSPFRPDGTVAAGADLHPSTWIHDESVIRCHLAPAFGTLRLTYLTWAHCKGFRKELQDGGRSGKTAQNILGELHKAMADAVEEGLLASIRYHSCDGKRPDVFRSRTPIP
jgi:hypothetical protein